MNKVVYLLIIAFLLFCLNNSSVFSQIECPHGSINCRGECGLFIDEDGDSICDFSIRTVEDTIVINKNIINTAPCEKKITKQHIPKDEFKIIPEKHIAEKKEIVEKTTPATTKKSKKKPYRFLFISILTITLYIFSCVLKMRNIITTRVHRRIWNIVLLIAFLVCGSLGLVLVIQFNYRILPEYIMGFKKWHVEFGIGMAIVLIFHIFWHLKYFIQIFVKS